jgi:group I intron endonuclease
VTNNVNGKVYIGKTKDPKRRWREHQNKNTGCLKLVNAFNKYGEDSFVFELLEEFATRDLMLDAEQKLIDESYGQSFNKSKSSKSPQLFGDKNGFFGKKHNEETKLKMKKAKEGKSNWTRNSIVITDKGIFASINLACLYHEIQRSTYFRRVKRGANNWIVI